MVDKVSRLLAQDQIVVSDNVADIGGGLMVRMSSASLQGSVLLWGNGVRAMGGGIQGEHSNLTLGGRVRVWVHDSTERGGQGGK